MLEEITLQLCLQAERAVLEAAIEDAIMFTVISNNSNSIPHSNNSPINNVNNLNNNQKNDSKKIITTNNINNNINNRNLQNRNTDLFGEKDRNQFNNYDNSTVIPFEKCLARKNVRWWGHQLHSKNENENGNGNNYENGNGNGKDNKNQEKYDMIDNEMLNLVKYSDSMGMENQNQNLEFIGPGSVYIAGNLPFDCEKAWFERIESGYLENGIDHDNQYQYHNNHKNNFYGSINKNKSPLKLSPKISPKISPKLSPKSPKVSPLGLGDGKSIYSIDCDTLDTTTTDILELEMESPNHPQLSIISPEPRFNRISGFLSRQQRQSARMSMSAHVHVQQLLESASSTG